MKVFRYLYLLILLTYKVGSRRPEPVKKNDPNVIIILTDDQGYGDMGFTGNPYIKTPALDKLAKESIRFTNFHVNATCMPTRAALMTGRYPSRSGIWHIQSRINMDKDEITMANIFKVNGYQTGIFGKWHLGDIYPFRPGDRGFQYSLIHLSGGIGFVPDYWGNDYFDDTYLLNNKRRKFNGYCTDVWFKNALQFIEKNHTKNRPFFLYLATNAPHAPYRVPEEYYDMYKNEDKITENQKRFYGMISNIDDNVKRLEDKLEELNIKGNTILIFMTDNGTSAGIQLNENGFPVGKGFNAGMRGAKGSIYEGGHRVPFFFRWPDGDIRGDREIDQLTVHMDLLPTLIDLLNLNAPDAGRYDGRSFASLLREDNGSWQDRIVFVQHQPREHPIKGKGYVAMTKRWRLVNGIELYNILQDPGQKNNIAKENPAIVSKLKRAYEKWWNDISTNYDEKTRAIIGSKKANPTKVSLHEWYFGDYPQTFTYRQEIVRKGNYKNGYWAVDVDQSGKYEFVLRRLPEEACETKPFGAVKARLKIADVDTIISISKEQAVVKFKVSLESAGQTKLQTWIIDKQGASKGAPFVSITHL